MAKNKIKHIAVAGNIGAGKTTLTEMLAKHYKWTPHFEDVEHNPYLTDFYDDMPRWSFNLQILFPAQPPQAAGGGRAAVPRRRPPWAAGGVLAHRGGHPGAAGHGRARQLGLGAPRRRAPIAGPRRAAPRRGARAGGGDDGRAARAIQDSGRALGSFRPVRSPYRRDRDGGPISSNWTFTPPPTASSR